MAELPKSNRPLPELMRFLGAPDEIEPVNRHLFPGKVGEIIARVCARIAILMAASPRSADRQ
jgi:hypothetical protein